MMENSMVRKFGWPAIVLVLALAVALFLVFLPRDGADTAELVLSPTSATSEVGSSHTVIAIVLDEDGDPMEGVEVTFVVKGANAATGITTTNPDGEATFTYAGVNEGDDFITSSADGVASNAADQNWLAAVPEPTPIPAAFPRIGEVILLPVSATNEVGNSHTVTAIALDGNGDPAEQVEVTFVVEGANPTTGTSTTNSDGVATFTYTGVNEGRDSITATAGDKDSDIATKVWNPIFITTPPIPTNQAPVTTVGDYYVGKAWSREEFSDPSAGLCRIGWN